jgi:hypothetical protein
MTSICDNTLTLHQPIGIRKQLLDKFQRPVESSAGVQHGPRISLRTMCKLCHLYEGSWLMRSRSYIYGGFGFGENITVGTISP